MEKKDENKKIDPQAKPAPPCFNPQVKLVEIFLWVMWVNLADPTHFVISNPKHATQKRKSNPPFYY